MYNFSFEFFGWSLKNLRNVEFLAENGLEFLTLSFSGLEFFENGHKKPVLIAGKARRNLVLYAKKCIRKS